MQIASEYRIRRILDEVGRGSNLESALSLIADAVLAESGVPVCKIWVVKRGDICERCPLADACSNRQMCMHLVAVSGADLAREYPRVPLAVFNGSMIARGGIADFSEVSGAGDKLFGLQRSYRKDALDSYALYPLRGLNGTVGLIGLFHHRPFHQDELRALEELAPAAVAAIRVAELQSRCDSLRTRLDRDAVDSNLHEAAGKRAAELEDAVAQLTHLVAQLQVERETVTRDNEELRQRTTHAEEYGQQLHGHVALLEQTQQRDRQRLEDENAQLKERLARLVQADSEHTKLRDQHASLESHHARLREEHQATADSILEVERSLRLAEDARERHEQQRSQLEARVAELESELNERRYKAEDSEQLQAQIEQLRGERDSLAAEFNELRANHLQFTDDLLRENTRLTLRAEEMTHKQSLAEARAAGLETRVESLREQLEKAQADETEVTELQTEVAELKQENASLAEQLQEAAAQMAAIAELQQQHAALQQQQTELQQQHEALTDSHAQMESRASEFAAQAAQIRPRTVELESQNERLRTRSGELESEIIRLTTRSLDLEQENAALAQVNQEMQNALERFESLSARLEDSAMKMRTRAEASERARAETEQRNRLLAEQNRRLHSEGHTRARSLANMSHELRTPMNAIIGFTSLLLDDRSLQLQDRHRGSLERVARNARNLLELINNVLDLSKLEAGRMEVYAEPADVSDIIDRAVVVVEPLKDGRPVQLNIETEDNLPTLKTDRMKLQQVLINLLSNALKFTAAGTVTVRAERAEANRLHISVSDTGSGINEADLPKIFEEFRQVGKAAQEMRSGTGLGLAITKRLVELLGGEIKVTSQIGEGSVFSVTLPIEIEGRAASTIDNDPPLADPERTALVIDSDPASLYLMKKYLVESGYSVAVTDDAGRGIEIARLAQPAVVTVDIDQLENGLSIIEKIAKHSAESTKKASAIIALASDASQETAARNAGATVFLGKPLERDRLISMIERAGLPKAGSVLVVDDDDDALALVLAMLEESSYEVQTARSGREALEVISQKLPDAIVLDLMLPEMDGFEVVHRLRVNPDWRNTPVLLLTAHDLSHEERRAIAVGPTRVIQKGGFTRDELLAGLSLEMGKREEDGEA